MATENPLNPFEQALAESRAQRELESQIANLLGEGKTSEAYRVFEQLPLEDQLGISIAPGIGDALAAFEVGEFKDRADKRFEQGDILGGIGNLTLSGLSGLSLVPLVGRVPGLAGDALSALGRVSRVPEGQPTGGPSSAPQLPFIREVPEVQKQPFIFDYQGTRPNRFNPGLKNVYEGVASPHRLKLALFDQDEEFVPEKLIKRLKQQTGADKTGELRHLDVLKPDGTFTLAFDEYVNLLNSGKKSRKLTPKQLDNYLKDGMDIDADGKFSIEIKPVDIDNPSYVESGNVPGEIQRVYKVKDVKIPEDASAHYRLFGNDILAFDATSDSILSGKRGSITSRIQSDYEEEVRKLASAKKVTGEKGDPYTEKKLIPEDINIDKIAKELKPKFIKAQNLTSRLNNLENTKKADILFEPDGKIKTNFTQRDARLFKSLTKKDPNNATASSDEIFQTNAKLDDTLQDIQNTIRQQVFKVTGDNKVFDEVFPIKGSLETTKDLPPGLKEAVDRLKFYTKPDEIISGPITTRFDIGRLRYAENKFDPVFDVKAAPSSVDIEDSLQDTFRMYNQRAKDYNEKGLIKPDPFATKTSTKSYVLPIRSIINEKARLGYERHLIDPEETFSREGGYDSQYLRGYYEDIAKEVGKVAKEIGLKPEDILKRTETVRSFQISDPSADLSRFFDIGLDQAYLKDGTSLLQLPIDDVNRNLSNIAKDISRGADPNTISDSVDQFLTESLVTLKKGTPGLEKTKSFDEIKNINTPLYKKVGTELVPLKFFDGTPFTMKGSEKIIKQGNIVIDTKKVKEALDRGEKITLMSEGGLAERNNYLFDLIKAKLELEESLRATDRVLSDRDRHILGENLDIITDQLENYDYNYLPDMLYGDFRDLSLEELQALREARMEQGVTPFASGGLAELQKRIDNL